jgi:hypothetical protein
MPDCLETRSGSYLAKNNISKMMACEVKKDLFNIIRPSLVIAGYEQ